MAAPVSTCAVAVDVALLTVRERQLSILLVEPDTPDLDAGWALPGRRVRDDESLIDCARRAVRELAGLAIPNAWLEQLATYGEPQRDPHGRVVSVAYLALVPDPNDPAPGDGRAARFVALDEIASHRPLAYDHDRILPDAIERARSKLEYTALATQFVQEPFTLGELRRVYEAVWGEELDSANFRRKVVSTADFVLPVDGEFRTGPGGGRPAQLYRRGTAERLHPAMLRP
ncbi:MAG: NUDIX domain-containing protein [Nitriliruptorales bacterium]|nr:NUDIX domain-containing protein [Nitriliruptorales bacterium]